MESLPYNLFLARRAINYVNISVGVISPNQLPGQSIGQKNNMRRANNELDTIRKSIQENLRAIVGNTHSKLYYRKMILLTSANATESKLGNCGEKAIIAFSHLKMLGVKPLDLFDIDIDDRGRQGHTIVVIGRVTGNETEPSTWNHESVVCDPWSNQVYPSSIYGRKAPFIGELILRYRYGENISRNNCTML
ncbi:hypothetical protein [Xenorhabdus littoralis]|uniref:hypothetical protein n=1 Tax=Xenorhabdus littoralis TaxID=2582835 RepID=UPI0029E7D3BD|nr:hypothetical protein [Xenorhabdus sp. psl]MDX7992827.1 hypothetical protein [Xenorhabdus sp. psl]